MLVVLLAAALAGCGSTSASSGQSAGSQRTKSCVLAYIAAQADKAGIYTALSKGNTAKAAAQTAALVKAIRSGPCAHNRQILAQIASLKRELARIGGCSECVAVLQENGAQVAVPNSRGTDTGTCNYVLGNFTATAQGFRFLADVTVHNTGNIGIITNAKAVFQQLGQAPVVVIKRVWVPVGQSKLVHLYHIATQDQVDLLQAANGNCSTSATIINTFGKVRSG